MSIQGFASLRRVVTLALLPALLVLLADVPAFARAPGDTQFRVTHQEVRIEGNVALVSYDLEAPEGERFDVSLQLRRESDTTFLLVPPTLTGDIGQVKSDTPHKLIRWEFQRELPMGLHGEDYYFQITVTRGGKFPWVWVGLGTAAAVVAVVALKTGRTTASPVGGSQELPMPPAR